ncbi:hypothetical protein [Nitrosospira multiformis]|jgi:hypothetical protein|uniref:Lipoprotein n=1 Tax=Nitrosospira multiformis (strain ATCC 25196 / NCIMB 11849 / C 71) TaxID=323848 RepID=Q2Y6M4_NITMU|nr:hypothetical protein [Nitrosospira multiformis]ABB75597.1 hypothetical protein Nmul_A2306 [Nitrosospira multiformis ATCC 25196]SEA40713.1 hypothetical protein SAMN05216411_108117 [Nitrosospira multiformis]SEF69029.1 hypothetical protein SAMN05216403_10622 [Nitrosospira multiformis ATCC 25196]
MKIRVLTLLAVPLLHACAGTPEYTQSSMKLRDGTTHYFIKTRMGPCANSRDWATRTLTKGANEICKNGYVLIDQQTPIILDPMRALDKDGELLWQIRCNDTEKSQS